MELIHMYLVNIGT